nr:hypothetical protein HUO10_003943 [Paraburkholderia busanensis]
MRVASDIRVEALDDHEQICALVNSVWSAQYLNAPVLPRWTPEFFDWQFLRVPDAWPAVCLGIYRDGELVGIFCGDCWPLQMDGEQTRATLLSCVSVSAKARHPDVAKAGLDGLRDWSEGNGSRYFVGFVNPESSDGVGRRYWTTRRGYAHAFSTLSRQWQINPMNVPDSAGLIEGDATGMVVEPNDLDAAVALLKSNAAALAGRDIATLDCSESRLRHQLSFESIARAVVVREHGEIGVCSFYVLPTHGGGQVGFFDYIASSEPQGALADKAFARAIAAMKAQHCERAFVLGQPNHDDALLQRLGFHPCFPSYAPLIVSWDKSRPLPKEGAFCSPIYR